MHINKKALKRFQGYSKLFNSPEGKEFINDFMGMCGVFDQTYVSGDPTQTAFNEGKRYAGSMLMRILNTSPEIVSRLVQQQQEYEQFGNILNDEDR